MTNQWFYGRGSDISGPVSGSELAELAASGKVLPSDTVWLEGRESGVPATRVKNLFPAKGSPPVAAPVAEAADLPAVVPSPVVEIADLPVTPTASEPVPADSAPAAPVAARPAPTRAARATAGKGAVIIGQDGKTVKYRGRCSTCGKEDSSWKSVAIPRGTARFSFFCPKCRKRQEVEIYGIH
jgi:GYF domain 2